VPLQVATPPAPGRRMLLVLRPERVHVCNGQDRAPGPGRENVLDARVTDVIYQGDTFLVHATRPDGTRLAARGIATAEALARMPARGEVAAFAFGARDAVLVADDR